MEDALEEGSTNPAVVNAMAENEPGLRNAPMQLAPKRRSQWMRFPEYSSGEVRRFLEGDGGGVDVVRMGQGDPIVLVPGLAGGCELLAPLARRLARRHEVILYSLRGDRGLDGGPVAACVGTYALDLARVIEGLRLERPTVMGVSFGGAVALEFAVEFPHRLGALVVQGAEARFRQVLAATIARRVLERYPLPGDNQFLNQFFNLLHGRKPEPGPLVDFVIRRCWETDQTVMAARLRALEAFDVSDRLWRIDVPTLVLAGTRDVIVPAERQRALAAAVAGARFETLPDAGHIGFLTHGREIAGQVDRLLRQARRSLC
jgi:pimeloyl-ACP methyl ester carboxylesterase